MKSSCIWAESLGRSIIGTCPVSSMTSQRLLGSPAPPTPPPTDPTRTQQPDSRHRRPRGRRERQHLGHLQAATEPPRPGPARRARHRCVTWITRLATTVGGVTPKRGVRLSQTVVASTHCASPLPHHQGGFRALLTQQHKKPRNGVPGQPKTAPARNRGSGLAVLLSGGGRI